MRKKESEQWALKENPEAGGPPEEKNFFDQPYILNCARKLIIMDTDG